jgi:hypothetical protein
VLFSLTIISASIMPQVRMRQKLIPRAAVSNPYPRFLAATPNAVPVNVPPPPSFVGCVAAPPEAQSQQDDDSDSDEENRDRAFLSWRDQFRKAMAAIVDEDSERANRLARCKNKRELSSSHKKSAGAERVYRNAWTELCEIQQELLALIKSKAVCQIQAHAIVQRLHDAQNQS